MTILCAEMFRSLVLWIIFSRAFVCSQAAGGNLSILLMVSNSERFNTSGAAVAFDLALKRINKEHSLLSGYELNLSGLIDDKVSINTVFSKIIFYFL